MRDLVWERLDERHIEELKWIWSDVEVIRYLNIKAPCEEEEIRRRVLLLKEHPVFAVRLAGKTVGVIGCPCIDENKGEFGLFYHFCRLFWGQGLATQSVGWLLALMKERRKHCVLYADVVAENTASERILLNYDFQLIDQEPDAFERDGRKMTIKNYKLDL